jgi:predicted O-linked N-acetylglucosamine transferase (SPINDLY family)
VKKTVDINKLFAEKKFSEIIYIIENKITDNQKNPQLINLLGVCRLLKGRASKNDLVLAIENFQNAFQRSNKINDIVEPYKNFINVSIKLYHYENSIQNNDYCFKNFQFALNFFDKNFELLSKLEKVVLAIIRIHKLFADVDKVDFYFSHLLKNNHLSVFNITNYIYYKSFNKKWSQLDFLESGKLLNDNLPLFNQNDLIPLNYKKQEKIRLGFLSADIYKKHSVTHFLKTILENYDENKYEIYLYLNHKLEDEDETTKLFRKLVKDSSNLIGLKDIEAINLIRNDKIDIMIDLMGVTSKNKLSLIKNRVSPIQISWCGYCNTTGMQEMDYLIADPNLILESEKKTLF